MKNITSTIVMLALLSISFGQKGQLDQLTEFGEGTVFKVYYISKTDAGYSGSAASSKYAIRFVNNVNDKLSAFEAVKEGSESVKINAAFGFIKPNHYTQPSMLHSDRHNSGYVCLDGIMYFITGVKDPQNIASFNIDEIWIPANQPKSGTEKKEGKKKMSLKEKMAAMKASMNTSAPSEIKDRDHDALLKKYFTDMQSIQAEATKNFTPEIKAEIAKVEGKEAADDAETQRKNAEFWNSEHGQKVLKEMRQDDVTIKNDTGGDLWLCYGQGVSTKLKPGETKAFSCTGGKVYKGTPVNSSQADYEFSDLMMEFNGTRCGETIGASTIMP